MTTYGELLRHLIDFTGSKLYAVADEVGYDVSYVSKWCNKDLLPAPKAANEVNKALVHYFSANIRENGRETDFFEAFPSAAEGVTLEKHLCTLLSKAYEASARPKASATPACKAELLTQRHQILACLRSRALQRLAEGGEVYCTIDLLTLLESRDFAMLDQLTGEGEFHFHAALSMERFLRDPHKNLYLLYDFLNRYSTMFVTLYDGTGLEREGILAARGGGALMTALSAGGELDALLSLEPGTDATNLCQTAMTRLKECPVLLAPARPQDMNRDGYRTDFYSRDQFQFFSTLGFEFFLPEAICEKLIQSAQLDDPAAKIIRRLFITWDEVFQKGNINFYLLKSSVLRYLESGELLFADIQYQMSPDERLEHINRIKDRVLHNPGIRFTVLDDDALPAGFIPNLSVYRNPKKLFLKNPAAYQNGKGTLFYTVQSEALIQATGQYLDSLQEKAICAVYDQKDIPEMEKRYGGMLYRMLTL